MLESFAVNTEMKYEKLSAEEQRSRGILGRLVGIIASFKKPTRNGRLYTEELWDKTFSNPIMQEKLENRCLFGELGHPVDRQEIDMEKIAICMAEKPKKGNDGNLYGVFDILDTPNGRILKTMCDYGCNIGVSSRGSGDTVEEYDGTESVEPDSYECECWDAVLLPAVKSARPKYVTESLNPKNTLKRALQEALETSSEDDKKVMEQTLNELGVDYEEEEAPITENVEDPTPEKVDDIDEVVEEPAMAAEDNGAAMIQELQESVKKQHELEATVKSLQEQLSVCYTKEARQEVQLDRHCAELARVKAANKKLNEEFNSLRAENKECKSKIEQQQLRIKKLHEKLQSEQSNQVTLTEGLTSRTTQLNKLQEEIKSLNESYKRDTNKLKAENSQLVESIEEHKKDLQILRSQTSSKLVSSKQLVEKYQSIAKTAVDKYIDLQARRLGVESRDIKSRLNESYSFNDIDRVCEDLQAYKLKVNALPFSVSTKKDVKMVIKESKEPILPNVEDGIDDDVDYTLSSFMN